MTLIRDRVALIRAGKPGQAGREWSDLYIKAAIEMDNGRTPNKAQITLYNLSDESLRFLEQSGLVAQILAGETTPGQLFFGDISKKSVKTIWAPPDWVTSISAADGRRIFRETRFMRTYPARTARSTIVGEVAGVMGISIGYQDPTIADPIYPTARAFSDMGREVLSELFEPDGVRWSIQSGALSLYAQGKPNGRQAILVSADTGMIGAPTRTDKGVSVKMDLRPEVIPGAVLVIESEIPGASGGFRVVKAKHNFSTFGDDWETSADCVIY